MSGKSESPLRWAVLFFACLTLLSNYYCYDNPAALKTQLQSATGIDENTFALTYSVYSFPNIVLPFFGGYFCDRVGAHRVMFACAIFLCAGQVLFAFGVSVSSVPLLLMGRVVYGFGGENMTVSASSLLAEWFRGKEMALAMGLIISIARLGSVINNFASPPIAKATNVSTALWFGALLCGCGIAATIVLNWLDRVVVAKIAQDKLAVTAAAGGKPTSINADGTDSMGTPLIAGEPQAEASPLSKMRQFKPTFWMLTVSCLAVYGCVLPFNNIASSLLMERTYFKPVPDQCQLKNAGQCQSDANPPVNCPSGHSYALPLPTDVTVDNKHYDTLKGTQVDCTIDVWAKSGVCTNRYCDRQTKAEAQATQVMSIPYIISAIASPFLGYAVDRLGGRAIIATICPVVLIAVHSLLGYSGIAPTVPLVGQGLAYSIFAAALWPSVPHTVPQSAEGLGYGIVNALQNAGLALFPLLVSAVYTGAGDRYIPAAELVFICFALGGLAAGICLNLYDCTHGHLLNRRHYVETKKVDIAPSVEPLTAPSVDGV